MSEAQEPSEQPVVVERIEEDVDPAGTEGEGTYTAEVQPSAPSGDNSSSDDLIDLDDAPKEAFGRPGWVTKPMTPERDRRRLAWALLAITAAGSVVLGWLALDSDQEQWARLQSLLAPFQTLLGLAVGYYFAERRSGNG